MVIRDLALVHHDSNSVTMETGKRVCAPVHISSAAAQTEKRMDVQAPLTAVYIHTVPALSAQPYPQLYGAAAAAREPAMLHLAMPPLYSKETLPFLTLHIAGGLHSPPGPLNLAAAAPLTARAKSAGKHVCPHCGRDCMKPSVLEKHLRCHTGERPYPCTTCGVSFKTQSNLYKHKRTQAHARLSSESEQSSLGSIDSMSSSRETHTSSLSLDEELAGTDKDATLPASEITSLATTQDSEQKDLTPVGHETDLNESAKVRIVEKKESEEQPPTARHLPLQRQKATLFSEQWESSISRRKSQNHESTDSGFSESSDHNPSPGSVLPDHCLDSLAESNKEHLEQTTNTDISLEGAQESKSRDQEQKTLEERISKLISENSVVVEDKQLENVRPRKTILSKQGSIDLPMPYTYKDSFHFDMKINKTPNVVLQRNKRPGLYSSVPTQPSMGTEHAPLTRSNSLPFSVTLLQPERSSPASPYQSNYVTVVRRGSSGQINSAGFTIKPVNQQSSTHRPLVRQTAVDCNHATDGLFMNSSAEEASTSSLSCDGDNADICGEPSGRKFRRKKAQKFAYNKWYMYGGGTFKKLYNEEKGGESGAVKGRKSKNQEQQETFQASQKRLSALHNETVTKSSVTSSRAAVSRSSTVDVNAKTPLLYTSCTSVKTSIRRNLSLSVLPLPSVGSFVSLQADAKSSTEAGPSINEAKKSTCGALIPSNRKKQKIDDKSETTPDTGNLHNPKHSQVTGALVSPCIIKTNAPSFSSSLSVTSPISVAKTSFLPKYQLKLPNTAEPDVNTSEEVMDKPTGTDTCTFTSAQTEQPSPSIPTLDPVDSKTIYPVNSSQISLPCKFASLCQAETRVFETSRVPGGHRQFAATTMTTVCLHDYQERLCSKSVQPLKPAPVHLPTPAAPVGANILAAPSITTANNHTSTSADTTISQLNSTPPSLQLLPQSNLINRECTGPNITKVLCHNASLDQMQPAGQNVFHVHTADLQICLQIITDEQLALIEPQIEHQVNGSLSQTSDMAAGGIRKKDERPTGHEKELDQCKSDMERITPPLSDICRKPQPNIHMTEHNHQALVSAESEPPEAQGLTLHPHRCRHVNLAAAETMRSVSDVMSTTAAAQSGRRSQNPEEERDSSLDDCPEEEGFLDKGVSRGRSGLLPGLSPSAVSQNEKRGRDSGKASTSRSNRMEGGETPADERSTFVPTFSIDTAPRESNSESVPQPCQDENTCCDRVGQLADDSVTFREKTLGDSPDVISSAHSHKQFTSESTNIQVERTKDIAAVITSPNAELTDSDYMTGCAAQRKLETLGHVNAPEQSDSSEWRPKPDQDPWHMFPLQREEGHSTGGIRTDQVAAQWTNTESDCRYMVLEGEDSEVGTDSFEKSRLSAAHLHHLSQTHSGMSEYSPQSPRPAPSLSNNLNFSAAAAGALTNLLNSPQPPLETSHLYFSQPQWESSSGGAAPNQPAQTSDSHSSTFTSGSQMSHIKKPFVFSPPEQHARDAAPHEYMSHDCVRSDASNSYQSFYLAAQLQGYQQAEGSSPGLRPVQSSHDYSEDTSSSDDEGKLIIEL